ncbi:MAG: HYR domain-containing protein [Candidatus Taylorbacteria bacterium]|nr:HYR domain-containing protein [Candidatus Taylorbacteria bacterium]
MLISILQMHRFCSGIFMNLKISFYNECVRNKYKLISLFLGVTLFFAGYLNVFGLAPVVSGVSISSDGVRSGFAKINDQVTLSFISDTVLDFSPVVSINGTTTGVTLFSPSGNSWVATKAMTAIDATGTLPFFQIVTASTTDGVPYFSTTTMTADNSSIIFDPESPILVSAKLTGGNEVTLNFSEPVSAVTEDFYGITLSPGGMRNVISISTTTNSYIVNFDGLIASTSAVGIISIGGGISDLAGNTFLATTTSVADGQPPGSPGTPVKSFGGSTANFSIESGGFSVTVPLVDSDAVVGDSLDLRLNGNGQIEGLAPHVISVQDLVSGSVVFPILHGQLGLDGQKEIVAKVTDVAGNIGPSGPALMFALDVSIPIISSAKISGGNQLTISFSKPVQVVLSDFSNFIAGSLGARALSSVSGSGSSVISLSFSGTSVSSIATGTVSVDGSILDLSGNNFLSTTTLISDGQGPSVTFDYSKNPTHPGYTEIITATFDESIADSPLPKISLSGSNIVGPTEMTKVDDTHYTFSYIVDAGNGTTTSMVSDVLDLAGNAIGNLVSNESFFIDGIRPLATISFSKEEEKSGNTVTISIVTDEPIADSPTLKISMEGGNNFAHEVATKVDSTHYFFEYTVQSGGGSIAVYLEGATDLAGNVINPTPTLENNFTIDNIEPSILISNPDSSFSLSKEVTATSPDGVLSWRLTESGVCDGGAKDFIPYVPAVFTSESDNGKQVCYKALDAVGNTTYATSNQIEGIDRTPPVVISVTISPNEGRVKINDIVTLNITADISGYSAGEITINGVPVGNFYDLGLGDGTYVASYVVTEGETDRESGTLPVSVVLSDATGNLSSPYTTPESNTLSVDANMPEIVFAKTISTTTINLVFSEDLDGTTFSSEGSSFSVEGFNVIEASKISDKELNLIISSGMNTGDTPLVSFGGSIRDLAGNIVHDFVAVVPLDGVSPIISESSPVPVEVNDVTPDYTFFSSESGTITYLGDCTATTTSTVFGLNKITFGTLSSGLHSNCQIKIVDQSGNVGNQISVSPFTIDLIVPTADLSSESVSPFNTSPIKVTAKFSKPVYDFEVFDVIVGNGLAGNFVSVDSSTYTFDIVPAGQGSVTVDVPATVTHDGALNLNTASAELVRVYDSVPPIISFSPYVIASTNQDITVNASVNNGVLNFDSHIFTENGFFDFVAKDIASNISTSTVTISNIDKVAPVFVPHGHVLVEAVNQNGAIASFTLPSVNDEIDSTPSVSCSPVSGFQMALGSTTISCVSIDDAGNSSEMSFVLSVSDTTGPSIVPPAVQIFEATTTVSVPNLVLATVADAVSTTTLEVYYSPHTFNVGSTTVTWTANDGAGNISVSNSVVVITDHTPPVVTSKDSIYLPAKSVLGAQVDYISPLAFDLVDGSLSTICEPVSGNIFSIGTTTVNCLIADSKLNTSTSQFYVVIKKQVPLTSSSSVNSGAPDIVVSAATVATSTVNVPSEVLNARIDISALVVSGVNGNSATIGGEVIVNSSTSLGQVKLVLPEGITISGPASWNGSIGLPKILAQSSVTPIPSFNMIATVASVVEIGSESESLILSKPARILLPNQANTSVGYSRSGSVLNIINTVCSADDQVVVETQLAGANSECKINVGSNLVIWTKHFTSFVTYREIVAPTNGPAGPTFAPTEAIHPTLAGLLGTTRVPIVVPVENVENSLLENLETEAPQNIKLNQAKKAKISSTATVSKTSSAQKNIVKTGNNNLRLTSKVSGKGQLASVAISQGTTSPSAIKKPSTALGSWFKKVISGIKSAF